MADSGFKFLGIYVLEVHYNARLSSPLPAQLETTINIVPRVERQENIGSVFLELQCSPFCPPEVETENSSREDAHQSTAEPLPGHHAKLVLVGGFEQCGDEPTLDFDQYLQVNAPASMFPFARELLFNISSRSPLPPILLDPVNLLKMLSAKDLSFKVLQSTK
jgi:hypothetical protein